MLNDRQQRFVEAYLLDPNGKQAAIKAGYSARSAEMTASRLIRNAKVAREIERRRERLSEATGITAERVLTELGKLGFSDIRHLVAWRAKVVDGNEQDMEIATEVSILDSDRISDQAAAAIAEVSQSRDGTLKVKRHDKLGALVKIGQHLGMFRPTVPEEPGKKVRRQMAALDAERGTEWERLLN